MAYSQDPTFGSTGIWEIGGTVSISGYTPVYNGETGDGITIFTFAPQLGYFLANGFELSLGTGVSLLPGITSISPSEGESMTVTQLFAAPSYNFQTSGGTAFPFIEGMIGYTKMSAGNDDASGLSYGGRGGVKVAVADHFLLAFSGQYIMLTLDPEGANERNGFNYFNFGVSVSGYF